MSADRTDATELQAAVRAFDTVELRLVRARDLHVGGPAREAIELLIGEVRVIRRRALNISRFCAHPARRGGAE